MKKLTLLRHGKAQPRDPANIPDRERTLEDRGQKDARRMGKFYAALVPDLIVSSPAKRALETATIFAENAGYVKDIVIHDEIYAVSSNELIGVLREQEVEHVLMVGHNPTLSDLVPRLDGQANRPIVYKFFLVTAATAHIVFKELDDWQNLQENSGQVQALISPRFVKDLDST